MGFGLACAGVCERVGVPPHKWGERGLYLCTRCERAFEPKVVLQASKKKLVCPCCYGPVRIVPRATKSSTRAREKELASV